MSKIFLSIAVIAVAVAGSTLLASHRTQLSTIFNPSPTYSYGTPEYTKNLNELLDIVQKQDPRAALAELTKRMAADPIVFQNCHVLAHAIGRAAYKKYGDFDTALKYQDTTCSDGYLHGVIEGKFSSIKNTAEAIAGLKQTCTRYAYGDRCWHGVGHGLMFYAHNDLPKALALCGSYTIARARSRCDEGVFMENFLSDPDNHPSQYVNADNPFKPCQDQPGAYKGYCYFYVPIYYLGLHNNDYPAAVKWCAGAEAGYVGACLRGVGSLAMKYNIHDPAYVENLCASAADRASCIDGMASYYLTFTDSLRQTAAMCAGLTAADKAVCQKAVKRNQALFQD